jgi:radical SAM superfamily enzyme YgiQ (UPF0313 family)
MHHSFSACINEAKRGDPLTVLLVEPQKSKKYHTPYPPLGLLKLATYHQQRGDFVSLVNGISENGFEPDVIYITSLFTYAWEPVHEVIRFYSDRYKKVRVIVGGVYASLCPDHLIRRVIGYGGASLHKRLLS